MELNQQYCWYKSMWAVKVDQAQEGNLGISLLNHPLLGVICPPSPPIAYRTIFCGIPSVCFDALPYPTYFFNSFAYHL